MDKFADIQEILKAHSILLKNKPFFEQDKIDIIESNESRDIKACPGSGKTTTLLAKLIILANRMPLENNQGICVLTHTNVSIDEIKSKLGNKADILFKYPNHFGTIQSFVDKFLAVPALKKYYGIGVRRIDSDIATSVLLSEFFSLDIFKDKLHNYLYGKFCNTLCEIKNTEINQWSKTSNNSSLKDELISFEILNIRNKKIFLNMHNSNWRNLKLRIKDTVIRTIIYEKKKTINESIEIRKKELIPTLSLDFTNEEIRDDNFHFKTTTDSGKSFVQIKEAVFKKGLLSYNDAYTLASRYYNDNQESLQKAFSSRFKYLFIDEMQDTDKQQLDIIDNLFDCEKTIVQRFGDHHQAIYNIISPNEVWTPKNSLPINNSKRFGENIAKVLRSICIEDNHSLVANPDVESLNPILIVFEKQEEVLPKFCELLKTKKIGGKTIWEIAEEEKKKDPVKRNNVKAVGWVGDSGNEERKESSLTIKSYLKEFNKQVRKKEKVNYDSLKSFLQKQDKAKVKDYSDKIIEALLHILSSANIKNTKGKTDRDYTKTSFLEEYANRSEDELNFFRSQMVRWVKKIHNSKAFDDAVTEEIKGYIKTKFYPLFNVDINNQYVNQFIDNEVSIEITEDEIKKNNVFEKDGIQVEVGTIHSVKGETHIATLYLETSYHEKHESERIFAQMKGNSFIPSENIKDTYIKETLKMAYVGMSRPKHLLCFAIHKSRFDKSLNIENGGAWEVEII